MKSKNLDKGLSVLTILPLSQEEKMVLAQAKKKRGVFLPQLYHELVMAGARQFLEEAGK